jgi:hypothetical protein
MSVLVTELYEALRAAGVDDRMANAAARAVVGADARSELATKGDLAELRLALKADLSETKAELLKWNVGALLAVTALYGGLVSVLKLFP